MPAWGEWAIILAVLLMAGGAFYIRLRWVRAPQAYRAMIALAGCYFVAGVITGAAILHLLTAKSRSPSAPVTSLPEANPSSVAPSFNPNPSGLLHYDPAHAALPDRKLTPGDVFSGVTTDDVCTPGWVREHRAVMEGMRHQAYAEYGRTEGPGCCEVDHLIPLELGGSNDLKNLWPQPTDPRPGDAEKDQLENELHRLVCSGKLPLTDAQQCIASDWVKCWERYVAPEYGPAWARENRHGW